jgi:hypothetical protein
MLWVTDGDGSDNGQGMKSIVKIVCGFVPNLGYTYCSKDFEDLSVMVC